MQQAEGSSTPASGATFEDPGSKSVDSMHQAPENVIATNSASISTEGSTIATIQTSNVTPATTAPLPKASLPWPDLVFVKLFANHRPAPCYRLYEEIDTLTLWAFLLSIIHAAFVVVGLQGLTKEPDGLSTEYLREILTLVNDSRATMNSTAAATLEPALVALKGLLVERQNVTGLAHDLNVGADDLNVLWLAGLALSLASLLVGMMCRQWLGELVSARRLNNSAHGLSSAHGMTNSANALSGSAHAVGSSVYNTTPGTSPKFPAIMYFWVSVLITSCAPALLQLASLLFVGGVVQSVWQQLRPALLERVSSLTDKHLPAVLNCIPPALIEHLTPTLLEHFPSADAIVAGVLPFAIDLAIEVLYARTSRRAMSTPVAHSQAQVPEPVPSAPRRRIGRSRARRAAMKAERYGVKSSVYHQRSGRA